MTHTETLNVLDELECLVSNQVQVVSYKWLSRNFSLPSNTAKRLLKDFVEKHGKDLEVVYTVSGWLKNRPSDYHTRLVSGSKLPEVEKEFNGKYSVHIYSVQASIPMDPAAIWNAEFVQAEEFFMQPSATDNCLRGNRFCGVSNSFVERKIEATTESVRNTVQSKSSLNFQKNTVPSNQGKRFHQSSSNVGHQAKSDNNAAPAQNQSVKSSSDKEKTFRVPANGKNGQNEKSISGTGGSLKNMWGRMPMKTEDDSATIEVKNHTTDHSEAQEPSLDSNNKGGRDDETLDANLREVPNNDNRKRKVIFDFSDEEDEDVISLASPRSPKINSHLGGELSSKELGPEKRDIDVSREMKCEEPEASEEDGKKTASVNASTTSSMEKIQTIGSEAEVNPSKGRISEAPRSPKRKKVLKSRIDDRGREVTEVVWEETETETNTKKKEDIDTSKKLNDSKRASAVNKAVTQKKSPAMGNAAATNAGGKTGNKKGGNAKDPKQGNIMSFFKKV